MSTCDLCFICFYDFPYKEIYKSEKIICHCICPSFSLEKIEKPYLCIHNTTSVSLKPSNLVKINQSANYRMLDIVEDTKDIGLAISPKDSSPRW